MRFLHTESPSMPVCWPPFVKVQPVCWVSCPVFSHIIGWVPFLFLYYCSSLYVSSYNECVIILLLAQGCHNDIKKPSCLISCDWSSPSTGIADVSCHSKGNCDLCGSRSPNTAFKNPNMYLLPIYLFCRYSLFDYM